MKYDRIFTFGCSWTKYCWPTWADMIRYTTDAPPVFNWGFAGLGNVGIFYRMVECDLKHKFTDRDLILVQWTSWSREDRYLTQWEAYGNVFNSPFYGDKFTKKYWHWNNDIMKNASVIVAANKMFNIAYQFNMIPFTEIESGIVPSFPETTSDLQSFYINNLPAMDSFPNSENTQFNNNCDDGHPDIRTHLLFFNNYIKDRFKFNLGDAEQSLIALNDRISNKINRSMNTQIVNDIMNNEIINFDHAWNREREGFK